jgi:hypothetical protein
MTHRARAPDGLDATRLNLSDDGANVPKLRDTHFIRDGVRVEQRMQLEDGRQKGLRTILTERGKFLDAQGHALLKLCGPCEAGTPRHESNEGGFGNEQCCATYVLSQEPDFLAQKEWLTEVIEGLGFSILFYPKYHCEFNFIELLWGWLKAYHRRNSTYNFKDLERELPLTVSGRLPVAFVRRSFRHCLRFIDGYRVGPTGLALAYAVRKYRSH